MVNGTTEYPPLLRATSGAVFAMIRRHIRQRAYRGRAGAGPNIRKNYESKESRMFNRHMKQKTAQIKKGVAYVRDQYPAEPGW